MLWLELPLMKVSSLLIGGGVYNSLVVGCWLLVIGCWLLVIGCWLLVVGYWLLFVGYWLLVIGCWFSAFYLLISCIY